MGQRFTVVSGTLELPYRCASCGETRTARITTIGLARGHGGSAQVSAQDKAAANAPRVLRLARCPACGKRTPGALRRAMGKDLLHGAVIAALVGVCVVAFDAMKDHRGLYLGGALVLGLVLLPLLTMRRRVAQADEIRFH